ncbi:MAG: hypothetical protein M0033_05465 [Nitrospiraceae bacterium]|nr:hypothetical protein [Nitrospiraceae bacterium]
MGKTEEKELEQLNAEIHNLQTNFNLESTQSNPDFRKSPIQYLVIEGLRRHARIENLQKEIDKDAILGKARRKQQREFAKARHDEAKREIEKRNAEIAGKAEELKNKHSAWSMASIANELSKQYDLKPDTLRKIIASPKK